MFYVRWPLAIAMLLTSHGIAHASDPTTADCLNANDRSIAMRNKHQLRAARSEMLVCAAPTCPEDVRNECARRVTEVNAAMPTVVFEARDSADNDLSAVAVEMDGQSLVPRLEGTAVSIDPGEHDFVFVAPGVPAVQKHMIIREGEKGRREKVTLGLEPTASDEFRPKLIASQAGPTDSGSSRQTTTRIVGIAVGAAGCLSLGVALFNQVTALNRQSHSESAAESKDLMVQATVPKLHEQAIDAQTYAIVFGAAGAIAVGAGLYLLLTSLSDDESRTTGSVTRSVLPVIGNGVAGVTYVQSL